MKRIVVVFLISLAVLGVSVVAADAAGFAVINMKKVFTTCQASKEAQAELNKVIRVKKTIIDKKRSELNALLKEINSKKISKKEKKAKEKIYRQKLAALRAYAAKAQRDVISQERKMSSRILKGIIDTVKSYAKRHHINIVFDVNRGGVIYWNDSLDITDTILKMYNERYKKAGK